MLTDKFLIALKQRYLDEFSPFLQDQSFEKKTWDFITKVGKVEVNVGRGDFLEKVCVSNIAATVTIPDRDYQSSIQWLGIQTFPSNPLAPLFMGVFEHVAEKGLEHHPAYFDVYPMVPVEEDRKYLQERIGAVCQKHGRTYPDLPESYLKMFRLKEAGIGVGYGAGLSLRPEEENAQFFEDAANAIFDAYMSLLNKRKESSYTEGQVLAMDRFRAEWTRFVFSDNRFYQGGVQLGVPPESFMIHMLPPTVKF